MDSNKRPENMVRITTKELADQFIKEQIELIRKQVGSRKVLLALSGGVDSSVVAALLIKAIGKQLVCVHVNHGLMRKGESEQVIKVFRDQMDANLIYIDATDRFLDKLVDVSDPSASSKKRHANSRTSISSLREQSIRISSRAKASRRITTSAGCPKI